MKKYNFKKIAYYLVAVLILGVYSCAINDDYKSFAEGGEISYTGKISELKVYPGLNRVLVEGLIVSDPKVSELRVYWNNGNDFIVEPVNRTSGEDEISFYINDLPENIYNFEVVTYDNLGNASLPVSVNAEVYGKRYIESLVNRPIVSSGYIGNDLTVEFAEFNAVGLQYTELEYENSVGAVIYRVENNIKTVSVHDYEPGTPFKVRTFYIPVEEAIDIFQTSDIVVTPETAVPFNAITLVNGDFAANSGTKIENWNGSGAGNNAIDIPGWQSDTDAADSGVEAIGVAFLKASDPSVYQTSEHVIGSGEEFKFNLVTWNIYAVGTYMVKFYYFDGSNRYDIDSKEFSGFGTITFKAIASEASVGHKLGIEIDNVTDGWLGMDDAALFYR